MPAHALLPEHDPPTLWERIRLHTSDIWLYLLAVVIGAIIMPLPFLGHGPGSTAVAEMDLWVSVGLAAGTVAGGTMALVGLLWIGHTESHGWTLEQSGCWLLTVMWFGYAVAVAESSPDSLTGIVLVVILGFATFTRAVVVGYIEKRGRKKTGRTGRKQK